MMALIASVFALGIGPLIYQTFGPMRRTDRIVSGFILVVIASTLFMDVLPETIEVIGYSAILLALLGFAGPTIIEKTFAKAATRTHSLTIFLGILGLVLHASIDGAMLQNGEQALQHENLSIAIILHRLPVGLTIWWLLRPLIGERFALLTLVAMAIATSGGFVLSMQLHQYHSSTSFVVLQAFISGSLMHVIFHKPHSDGCMHTSQSHQHLHIDEPEHRKSALRKTDHQKTAHQELDHHSQQSQDSQNSSKAHSQTHKNSLANKIKNKLPDQWEAIGMSLGIVTVISLHLFF